MFPGSKFPLVSSDSNIVYSQFGVVPLLYLHCSCWIPVLYILCPPVVPLMCSFCLSYLSCSSQVPQFFLRPKPRSTENISGFTIEAHSCPYFVPLSPIRSHADAQL